jgi:hypothetical protein
MSVEEKGTEMPLTSMASAEKSPRELRQRQDEKKYSRTTIVVDPDLYKQFKAFAASTGTTVTALLNGAMRNILGK